MRLVISTAALGACVCLFIAPSASADQVISDDLIVMGSNCVGLDCVNNETFGFDTLRFKENNTRLKFDDTSTALGFPSNDWALQANESPSGGANRFMLFDDTAGRVPFSVFAGAPANALVITAAGEVRAGTFVSQAAATLNPQTADAGGVLQALRTLDLSTGAFTADPVAPRHLGPTAHDFHLAFGLGADDGTIAPGDMAGAALAATKALDARGSGRRHRPPRPGRRHRAPRPGWCDWASGPCRTARPEQPPADRATRDAQQAPREAPRPG
jgi:hypothetical protein